MGDVMDGDGAGKHRPRFDGLRDIGDLREQMTLLVATMNADVQEVRALRSGINGELIVLVRNATKDANSDLTSLLEAKFSAFASEIRATVTIQGNEQSACVEYIKGSLGTTEFNVASHAALIESLRKDHDEVAVTVAKHTRAIDGLVASPGEKAKDTVSAWKASLITAAGLILLQGLWEGVKYLTTHHGKPTP